MIFHFFEIDFFNMSLKLFSRFMINRYDVILKKRKKLVFLKVPSRLPYKSDFNFFEKPLNIF